MFRLHVKVKGLLLQEFLGAVLTFVRIHAGMFLQVVVHGVLALVGRRTMRTDIESFGIFLIVESDNDFRGRHFWCGIYSDLRWEAADFNFSAWVRSEGYVRDRSKANTIGIIN